MSHKYFFETITPSGGFLIVLIEYTQAGLKTKTYRSYLDMPEDERKEYLMSRVLQTLQNHRNQSENVSMADREQIDKIFERILQNKLTKWKNKNEKTRY